MKRDQHESEEQPRGVRRAAVIDVPQPESRQLPPEAKLLSGSGIIKPTWDPLAWAEITEKVTRLKTSVSIMARTTVGLGYDIEIDDEWAANHNHVDSLSRAAQAKGLLREMLADSEAVEQFRRAKYDEEATGSGYLEIIRSGGPGKQITRIVHARATAMRRTLSGAFVQYMPSTGKLRYFPMFGSASRMDPTTGKLVEETAGQTQEGPVSEVIQTMLYSPVDPWYGAPRASGCDKDCQVIRQAGRRNSSFLSADATPRIAVMMEGGTAEDFAAVEAQCRKFVKTLREDENAPRILLLSATASRPNEKTAVRVQELGATNADSGFVELSKEAKENIREAFGLAKVLYGTADEVNKASALATLRASVETVIWPEQDRWERAILQSIATAFHPALRIVLRRPSSTDASEFEQRMNVLTEAGMLTLNELRTEAGYAALVDEDGMTDMPVALIKLQAPMTPESLQAMQAMLTKTAAEVRHAKSVSVDATI